MMNDTIARFFDHSRHKLAVHGLAVPLDVLAFEGEEQLSQPFLYRIEFTSVERDIAADQILGKSAQFSLHAAPHTLPKLIRGLPVPKVEALRTLHGVIAGFKRLSGSADEARCSGVASNSGSTSTSRCRRSSRAFCVLGMISRGRISGSPWCATTRGASR
jgi:hypothetical protein